MHTYLNQYCAEHIISHHESVPALNEAMTNHLALNLPQSVFNKLGRHLTSVWSTMSDEISDEDLGCDANCSGHGECFNGSCYCQIQFEGAECKRINFSYHVAFASIFFLLALTSLIQLVMCIHAEYLRMKKNPSVLKACRVTTQKFLYFLTFLATSLRGAYFAAPTIQAEWSISLLSAYYPVVLSGASLIVCFWAEVFHLQEIRWDRPRFLSKSFLGFVIFNVISYSLLITELVLVWLGHEHVHFYTHIFNGCYAFLMFVVVIFFLIYGVEVFFKVRGGFTVSRVPTVINSARRQESSKRLKKAPSIDSNTSHQETGELLVKSPDAIIKEAKEDIHLMDPLRLPTSNQLSMSNDNQMVNPSQLHQSRLGLLSQALMMIITTGFLFSETLEEFWKTKVNLTSRNTHDIIFRTIEIGVALWFPCVLWNCIRPEQLWCLNPKKILERFPPLRENIAVSHDAKQRKIHRNDSECSHSSSTDDDDEKGPDCWICYDPDRNDCGPMIHPCDCRGDVGAVHHDCLRRWLVESADNPEALKCKVCSAPYMVEKGSQFSLSHGFTPRQWLQTASLVTIMCLTLGGSWAVIQLYSEPWIRMLAVGIALLIQYLCLRSLGLNTVTAYQRAKVSALKIVNLRIGGHQPRTSGSGDKELVSTQSVHVNLNSSNMSLPSLQLPQQTRL